ncbi:metal dependent phosphohydrolase [Clostridium tetani]|uniref:Metal dependent phosphohydrolase n=2 Tax=Clostridium tetani TaxID=1513 RepID=Q892R8_CLOTE|nr:metal dependent phosphohydrolase [Clostridium tetani E88]SJZ78473.1 metal dependent phosphohydrolase [Clostridium tetani]SUY56956.1 metal dependent phosphohydrolase [Clostridium tetani]SUY67119.1 metal dependent phosphohydrolase [Clostridium tetani]BDR64997.1 hydrolase [Clostridium tetani]
MDKNILSEMKESTDTRKKILIFVTTFIIIYFVLITSIVTQKYSLMEGEIANVDIKATREVVDDIATKARVKQAIESVPLQYNKKPEVKNNVLEDLDKLFNKIPSVVDVNISEKDKINKLREGNNIKLSDEDYMEFLKLDKDNLDKLKVVLVKTISDLYDGVNISDGSVGDNSDDIKKAREFITEKINDSTLNKKSLKNLATIMAYSQIKPNFFYDEEKTEELREEAKKRAPVIIKKGQIIVKEGEPVTKAQIDILAKLGLLNSKDSFEWYIYLSLGILIALVMTIQWIYIRKFKREIFDDVSKLILINIFTCMFVTFARILSKQPFLIPLACIPMLFTLLIDGKLSLVVNGLTCILISCAVEFNVEITLLAIINVLSISIILKKMQERNDILYSVLYISIVNVILTFSAGVLLSNNTIDVVKKAGFSLIGSLLSGIFTIGFLPFFESTFDIVTTIKLLELSNPNNPLLKKLLMEAPGTYHHSVLVGNLAEVAAEQVGGSPVLARVASYYHDIGKIKRPYFFKENQLGNDNPHDKINPNLSTLIITAHVKDGIELAEEYKIPKVIRDVIEQHHGTTLVKYFYITMKNSMENPEEIKEEDFRYAGPKPESKEAAIIMLADSVEAAVRSISDPTKGKIEEMVNNIIKGRLNEGQLDNCDLTLKDIDKIRNSFVKILLGIYHQRIEYPTDKWQNK